MHREISTALSAQMGVLTTAAIFPDVAQVTQSGAGFAITVIPMTAKLSDAGVPQ